MMKTFLAPALSASLFLSARSAEVPKGAGTIEELRAQLEAAISQPRFSGALWGVKIVSLDSGRILFESHADRLLSPASNSKLYTSALVLDQLGAGYRIATPIMAAAPVDHEGTLPGDLIVCGRGDPSWNSGAERKKFWEILDPFV